MIEWSGVAYDKVNNVGGGRFCEHLLKKSGLRYFGGKSRGFNKGGDIV